MSRMLDAEVDQKKTSLTPDRIKEIAMGQIKDQVKQGSGFFGMFKTTKKGYEIPPEEAGKFIVKPYDQIPAWIQREAADTIQSAGQVPTKEAVERFYARGVRAGHYKD